MMRCARFRKANARIITTASRVGFAEGNVVPDTALRMSRTATMVNVSDHADRARADRLFEDFTHRSATPPGRAHDNDNLTAIAPIDPIAWRTVAQERNSRSGRVRTPIDRTFSDTVRPHPLEQVPVTEPDRPRIIAPAPLFYLPAFVVVTGLHWLWPLPIVDHPATPWVGRAILFPGLALHLWGVWSMKRNRTPINPYHPPKVVVSSGPFRISRNPLYVGLNLVLSGLVLILNSVAGLVVILTLFAIVHFGVILPEERYLERKFGATYSRYRELVRRYL